MSEGKRYTQQFKGEAVGDILGAIFVSMLGVGVTHTNPIESDAPITISL